MLRFALQRLLRRQFCSLSFNAILDIFAALVELGFKCYLVFIVACVSHIVVSFIAFAYHLHVSQLVSSPFQSLRF